VNGINPALSDLSKVLNRMVLVAYAMECPIENLPSLADYLLS
jgi:hypothetical protein